MKKNVWIIFVGFLVFGEMLAAKKMVKTPAEELIIRLEKIKGKGVLFGHQDDLAYGKTWKFIEGESDVKQVTGDYPAMIGWEIGGLEKGDSINLDGVPFSVIQKMTIKAHEMGGINTYSWHPYSLPNYEDSWFTDSIVVKHLLPGEKFHKQFCEQLDILADFFSSIKDDEGNPIPFIFRPWHEMNGAWFWWGSAHCTTEEYQELFRFTINYLRNTKKLNQLVTCYSPNIGYKSTQEFLTWYPGDDVVDMLGLDAYEWPGMTNWVSNTQKALSMMISVAKDKNMPCALTETGIENMPDTTWFTQTLWPSLAPDSILNELTYLLLWRNAAVKHQFFPYKGHPAEQDILKFLDHREIWLLEDLKAEEKEK